jgi:hypothetical protein
LTVARGPFGSMNLNFALSTPPAPPSACLT